MRKCLILLVLALTATAQAAGPEPKYKAPRTADGHPDLQGTWNFSSDVPLQRPAIVADKKIVTREEIAAMKTQKAKAFAIVPSLAPVEAVSLDWLDFDGQIENLRSSLITYPENEIGRAHV